MLHTRYSSCSPVSARVRNIYGPFIALMCKMGDKRGNGDSKKVVWKIIRLR